jgi:hypothetical protein
MCLLIFLVLCFINSLQVIEFALSHVKLDAHSDIRGLHLPTLLMRIIDELIKLCDVKSFDLHHLHIVLQCCAHILDEIRQSPSITAGGKSSRSQSPATITNDGGSKDEDNNTAALAVSESDDSGVKTTDSVPIFDGTPLAGSEGLLLLFVHFEFFINCF